MQYSLDDLNSAQLEAVTTTEGFVRVIAGAGSGKTRALTMRFAYLVNDMGILPGNILCVTFTNKAANEMRQRIHNLTGDSDTGYINTFHGFCVSVLQEDSHAVSYPKSFIVLDNSDIDTMLEIIYQERGLTLRDMTYSKARDMIEILKLIERPDYYNDMINMSLDVLKEKYDTATSAKDIIFYGYLYQEKKCFGLDYNDLLKFTLHIFETNEDIRLKWQKRLEYIMIDEFQDIDDIQYKLMKVLCDYHKNLFIVGDPDQTIYTWRGARVRYLLEFDKAFPDTKTIMMMQNYRSTPEILDVSNSLIAKNLHRIDKNLIPTRNNDARTICHFAHNNYEEAKWIADRIDELHANGAKYQEICIMYRAHYVTRVVEDAFLKQEIPYTIYSGVQFFERAEIKDALSYLRMIAYKDDLSFLRIVNRPRRNIGRQRIDFLKEAAERDSISLYDALIKYLEEPLFKGTKAHDFIDIIDDFSASYQGRQVSEVLSDILNRSGYEKMLRTEGSQERLDNLAELKQSIYDYEVSCGEDCSLEDYISHVALYTNTDLDDHGDKVKMMTVHAAKGLEFPIVFLCGMNEGIFPSRKVRTLESMEEERRLAFVAVTRAKDRLFITESDGRNLDGSPKYPSRFILDVDQELIDYTDPLREGLIENTLDKIRLVNMNLKDGDEKPLEAGSRIRHKVFGDGTVIDVDMDRQVYVIKFDNMETERNIVFRVKLESIE